MKTKKFEGKTGEWRIAELLDTIYIVSNDTYICEIMSVTDSLQEKANAKLIAASPELLEYCQLLLEFLDNVTTSDMAEQDHLEFLKHKTNVVLKKIYGDGK